MPIRWCTPRGSAGINVWYSVERQTKVIEKTSPNNIRGKQEWIPLQKGNEGWRHVQRDCNTTHPDFANEKNKLEHYINNWGHTFLSIPKYHCELNLIEHCWSQAKWYTQAYCNYSLTKPRWNTEGLDRVMTENIQNYLRDYMYGYLLGHQAGLKELSAKCQKLSAKNWELKESHKQLVEKTNNWIRRTNYWKRRSRKYLPLSLLQRGHG